MKLGFCSALLSFSLLIPAVSAQNASWKPDDACLGVLKRASLLLDNRVGDKKEKTLGKVRDLLLDLSSSQVMITLVSGAEAGQLTPVPARCYKYASGARLVIDVDKSEFKGAPHISGNDPFKSLDPATMRDSFFYFNQNPPQLPVGGRFCSTANLIDTPVVSQSEEPLGKVRDVMIDVPTAQVVYLIVEPNHAPTEAAEQLFVVPPVSVQLDKGGARLLLKGNREHFMGGPQFSAAFWSDLAFRELARATRQHYGLEPAPVQIAPTEKTVVTDDYQITRAILAEITHSAQGPLNTTMRITTVRGHVTLSGTLKDESQKKQIVTAARRVAGAANVEDNLETNDKARTAKVGVVGDL